MTSSNGKHLKLTVFGESHGAGVGCVIDGLPSGVEVDMDLVARQNNRRRPGSAAWTTKRNEADEVEFLSGIYEGKLTGTPLAAFIKNNDTRSGDYALTAGIPRPGHADLTAIMRYNGASDPRGGGHFSGRVTAALVSVGAVCQGILATKGIQIAAHVYSIADIRDEAIDPMGTNRKELLAVAAADFPCISEEAGKAMQESIAKVKTEIDSLGGIVEFAAYAYPAGIGGPFFGGIEPQLAQWFMGVPAVKGVEFGAGFAVAGMKGSQYNDVPSFQEKNGRKVLRMLSNNSGGADGGISTGMPIIARVALRPTASIAQKQRSVNLDLMEDCDLAIKGRHDPCIVPRAVPVIESVGAIALLDMLLASGRW